MLGIANRIPQFSSETWTILWLVMTVMVLLESVYQVTLMRNRYSVQLDTRKANQELSDKMSDHHGYAVHELLNKPPQSEADLDYWMTREKTWRDSVVNEMRKHGCSKQEEHHVRTLGLVTTFAQSPAGPAVSHQLSMLVTRMGRIADVAGKYGE